MPKSGRNLLILLAGLLAAAGLGQVAGAWALSGGACSPTYWIDVTLPSQARWSMCWEDRVNEGIILYNVTFTPPQGQAQLVLAQANLAQLHVPYDDNGARLHDLSDFGLGGGNLANLTPDECPGGLLLTSNNKNVLCQAVLQRGYAYKYYSQQFQGYLLNLFSVSRVGAYNYIVQWRFYDNGVIEPAIGAAGNLQRYGNNPAYGWLLDNGNTYGVAHTHNYYWRLDFDLAGAADDAVEEINFTPSADRSTFSLGLTEFATETARQVSPATFRTWRVKDKSITNSNQHPISYELEPDSIYLFRGPAFEPWTQAEFYATRYNPCEKWASHNPTGGGCADNLSGFVNGESLVGSDVVIWYGHSFHHLPRDEDEAHLHTHWNSFVIQPRDWTATNALVGVVVGAAQKTYLPFVLKK